MRRHYRVTEPEGQNRRTDSGEQKGGREYEKVIGKETGDWRSGWVSACVRRRVCAGRAVSLSTHHYRTDDCRDYGKLSEMEQKLGYRVDAVEKFENGYRFDRMSVNSVQGKDEARNEIYSFQSLNIVYEKRGEESISLFVEKPVETPARDSVPDATRVCGGVTLYYESITNKQVPPDYVLTKEDKEGEARGDFYISVGTPEVEIHQNSTVRWEKDGVQYMPLGFDLNLDAEELFDMAEKIMGTK